MGWEVEDGFFGALLGAVLGVIAPGSPPLCFVLLTALLTGIVMLLNKVGEATSRQRGPLIASTLVFTLLGSLAFCLIGSFRWEYALWLATPVGAWVLVKLESEALRKARARA
jgi:uncharacterized membrane protein YfcA